MRRITLALMVLMVATTGGTCVINPGGGGWAINRVNLDDAQIELRIRHAVDDDRAQVEAAIFDADGFDVDLTDEQYVQVNGTAVERDDADGEYTARVDTDTSYTVSAREPTRGVEHTTVDAPAAFTITSPVEGGEVSLGDGFTVEWSEPDDRLLVKIRLEQTFNNETRTETFGTFTDTGERSFTAADLRRFVQGADLEIRVIKIRTESGVNGFDDGEVTVEVWADRNADPRN
jgi:hypothetical protein